LKIIKFLFLFLFALSVLHAQEKTPAKEAGEKKDSVKEQQQEKPKDAIKQYYERNPQSERETGTPVEELPTGPGFWGPFIFLLIVVVVLYFLLRYIRKKKAPPLSEVDFMQNLGTLSLSGGAYLEIVEIGEKIYLLGVGSSSVNMLLEIEDKDLILKLKTNPLGPKHRSFLDVLGNVFEKKGKNFQVQTPHKTFVDFIKTQKDRLKKLK
jgi:flagellar biogenesis protein FliO